jgi:hypothetical protein
MFTLFMVVATLALAALFILPLVGYALLGLNLLKSEKPSMRIAAKPAAVHMKVSHA